MMKPILFVFTIFFALRLQAQPMLILEPFASGFSQPVDIAHAGDDRLFIVEKRGLIKIVDPDGNILSAPFLDIDARVRSNESERGLLGLAFHPDYANNGFFFVNYTDNNGNTRVSRFSRNANDPDLADPNSEKLILAVTQPFNNHNGGDLAFGPDGYLYIGLGDGGSGGDPGNRSQTTLNLLGKMLRLDIDTDDNTPYAIPSDNPFIGNNAIADEIWGIGLRNPWRFSFDRETGDLWIGDVGQNAREEVDFQPASSTGGENYGWRCFEGSISFNQSEPCPDQNSLTFPVYEYAHINDGNCRSITGGFVYRGRNHPDLVGHYIYADFCTGIIGAITPNEDGGWDHNNLLNWNNNQIVTFGEDVHGELYFSAIGQGTIYQVKTSVVSATDDFPGLEEVTLSPNPFQDRLQLRIKSQLKGDFILSLSDINGREVFSTKERFAPLLTADYELSDLAPGIYFVRIKSGKQVASWKVVKW